MRIAVDTGGTFTDCVYLAGGELRVLKVLSTAENPATAILSALRQINPASTFEMRHGTTVGTNALIERRGARVAFVTTEGFEDAIAIGRQARGRLYDLFWAGASPLAGPGLRFGVHERTASDGSILERVDRDELSRLAEAVRAAGAESVAVSLLFSFANPANERAVLSALEPLGVPVSASHRILPEFREYERGSTVLINAYLAPKLGGYIYALERGLESEWPGAKLSVMQSSGGIISAHVAAREPVRTILSGPAGGAVGASHVAHVAGYSRAISFDMGGTSTDVALVDSGSEGGAATTTESLVTGLPVAVPMLDIHTVGAGGGSLARFDAGGALRVGPESAGADPGPICFGRGAEPTVTDAHLIAGRMDPDSFLDGAVKLDEARAREFFMRAKGRLETAESFAEGILRLANLTMEKALRVISIERGYDPRDFTLVAFGGAGPLHACALARALGIRRVLVPAHPGALSALGILMSDVVRDYSRTVMLPPEPDRLEPHFHGLERAARREMRGEGLRFSLHRNADLRYRGQGYELNVPWSKNFLRDFHRAHERRYGYQDPERPVEVVNVRVRAVASTVRVPLPRRALHPGDGRRAIVKTQRAIFGGRPFRAKVYRRSLLRAGDAFFGPAVIGEYSATTAIPPGFAVRVDARENLVIETDERAAR